MLKYLANTLECHDFLSEDSNLPRTSKIPRLSTPLFESPIFRPLSHSVVLNKIYVNLIEL